MNILGIIIIITGLGLFFAGNITNKSLPPDYNAAADDGFFELLCSVGKVLKIAGCVFVVIGILCLLSTVVL